MPRRTPEAKGDSNARKNRWLPAVRTDLEVGRIVDVTGTPTMFINGKRVMICSLEGMKATVDEELKKGKG
jgi:protein-disulfide isomerase